MGLRRRLAPDLGTGRRGGAGWTAGAVELAPAGAGSPDLRATNTVTPSGGWAVRTIPLALVSRSSASRNGPPSAPATASREMGFVTPRGGPPALLGDGACGVAKEGSFGVRDEWGVRAEGDGLAALPRPSGSAPSAVGATPRAAAGGAVCRGGTPASTDVGRVLTSMSKSSLYRDASDCAPSSAATLVGPSPWSTAGSMPNAVIPVGLDIVAHTGVNTRPDCWICP